MANSLATPIRLLIIIRGDVLELSERAIVGSANLRVTGYLLGHQPDDESERDTVFGRECAHAVVHVQEAPSMHPNHLAKLQSERDSHASTGTEFSKTDLSLQLFQHFETETRDLCSI